MTIQIIRGKNEGAMEPLSEYRADIGEVTMREQRGNNTRSQANDTAQYHLHLTLLIPAATICARRSNYRWLNHIAG